ncbi:DUF1152 domain-containing protein [Streptomyces sp. NPDC059398]|uniref:DUF1152 domain-containing protein n=1 Tax=Streptomyces sp. NPDC059398 TaxID=3346820 RepID=UPI0036CA0A7C
MKRLLIAAGGGGDAIATAMVHAALHGPDEPALVLTYAWERLVVDPVPGPRRPSDFTGTVPAGPVLRLVTPGSAPRPPAGSLLPRLAGDLRPALGLLDPYEGALGLARQIQEAAAHCGAGQVDVVDVGGDILANGTEPTLRSPLGDALVLAACAHTGISTAVHVAGPGLDSEVPEAALLPLLGDPLHTLTPADTLSVQAVFDWHPSEAGALLVAAARGIRGVCGTRDAPQPVTLGDASPCVYRLTLERALELNPLARELAGSATLAEAERASERVCGFSEIARERARAARLYEDARDAEVRGDRGAEDARDAGEARGGHGGQDSRGARDAEDAHEAQDLRGAQGRRGTQDCRGDGAASGELRPLAERFTAWERRTAAAGIAYVTTRRIAEELALTPAELTELRHDLSASPARHTPPLWRLAPG